GTSHLASDFWMCAGLAHIDFWSVTSSRANPFTKKSSFLRTGTSNGFSTEFVTLAPGSVVSGEGTATDCAPRDDAKTKNRRSAPVRTWHANRFDMKHFLKF